MNSLDEAVLNFKFALLEKQQRDQQEQSLTERPMPKQETKSVEALEPVVEELTNWLVWNIYNPDRLKQKSFPEIKSEIRNRVHRPFNKTA